MSFFHATKQGYQRFYDFLEQETKEPTLSWGLRMGLAVVLPLIYGISTGHRETATWISLTAEIICWVELKGGFDQRLRTLLSGMVLTLFFGILGSIIGLNIWIGTLAMLCIGFLTALSKNLGERGSSQAICMYVLFLVTAARPLPDAAAVLERGTWIFLGGLWALGLGLTFTSFMPLQAPYRASVSAIWRSASDLASIVIQGWNGKGVKSNIRQIYEKERDVRSAIDSSLVLYEEMSQKPSEQTQLNEKLAHSRKTASLVAANISSIMLELQELRRAPLAQGARPALYNAVNGLARLTRLMSVFVFSLRQEDFMLLSQELEKQPALLTLLRETAEELPPHYQRRFLRVAHLCDRSLLLIRGSIEQIKDQQDASIFASYSLLQTMLVLHPRHWLRHGKLLFNFNSHTLRYALRMAIAAALGFFVYVALDIDHGYWLPFTILVVIQPYFGATLNKASDRIWGTLLGGLAGGLLVQVATGLFLREVLLFASCVLMVRFIRKKYSWASFFITLNLVLLFSVYETFEPELIYIRALATLAGAGIAIAAGFLLLPAWDKKWLPRHLIDAIRRNAQYFYFTFYETKEHPTWTRQKRLAEAANANAFDSFNRYMQEPALSEKPYPLYYQIITHNVRITRHLNNIQLELHADEPQTDVCDIADWSERCRQLFNECMALIHQMNERKSPPEALPVPGAFCQQYLNISGEYSIRAMHQELTDLRYNLEVLYGLMHPGATPALPATPKLIEA